MQYSKHVTSFVDDLISLYGKYNKYEDRVYMTLDKVPDSDLQILASLIMRENFDIANEATGADNPQYERKMLPTLLDIMENVSDKDSKIEFVNNWIKGASDYCSYYIDEVIAQRLEYFNHERAA